MNGYSHVGRLGAKNGKATYGKTYYEYLGSTLVREIEYGMENGTGHGE